MAELTKVVEELIEKTEDGTLTWRMFKGGAWSTSSGLCKFIVYPVGYEENNLPIIGLEWDDGFGAGKKRIDSNDISPLIHVLEHKHPLTAPTTSNVLQTALDNLQSPK